MTATHTTVWRITTRRFADQALTGDGARLYGGRWNRVGQPVVYTAQSRSLALLEMLVQDEPLRAHYVLIPLHLPGGVSTETLDRRALPPQWRTDAGRGALQTLGGEWLRQKRCCVLAVPSAVVPAEFNFLINPLHPDFKHITLGAMETLDTDRRLV
ncbi:MAG: RES family NAD+ phosphorylase [Rhodoferax sp.]|nr:RES family NAD+ phosphorylase [Rhodoferax sp.]